MHKLVFSSQTPFSEQSPHAALAVLSIASNVTPTNVLAIAILVGRNTSPMGAAVVYNDFRVLTSPWRCELLCLWWDATTQ